MKALNNLGKWQNYVHYLLLTGAIFFIHHLTDITGVEKYAIDTVWVGWVVLFLFYAIGIFLSDTIIHFLFCLLPESIKWED